MYNDPYFLKAAAVVRARLRNMNLRSSSMIMEGVQVARGARSAASESASI
jgi:hypothetical protein